MKTLCGTILAVAGLSLAAYSDMAQIYSVPDGERIYQGYTVTVNGAKAPVSEVRCSAIPFNRRWPGHQRQIEQTELCGMVRFAFEGKATVSVTTSRDFKEVKVRPLSRNVSVRREGRMVTFELDRPGGYSVEFDGYHNNLHVFADAAKKYDMLPNAIVFGPGVHEIGIRTLKSGDTVYIDPGAVVYGGFHAKHARDIRIIGCGIIDASKVKERILFKASGDGSVDCGNAERDYTIDFEDCRDFVIDGPVIRDSLAYNVSLWGCEDAEVRNVKIIGQWRYNTDGIDLRSCRRVKVSDCFARTFDDTFCFKCPAGGYGNCEDNVFERCVAWNDWGKAFEVGVGCRAEHMRRVTFRDCDCIHAVGAIMDVTNVDDGRDSDILFEDIRVECDEPMPKSQRQKDDGSVFDAKVGLDRPPCLFQSVIEFHHEYSMKNGGKLGGGGFIDGVILRNVSVSGTNGRELSVRIVALDEKHRPENVVFEGCTVDGKPIRGREDVALSLVGPALPPRFVASADDAAALLLTHAGDEIILPPDANGVERAAAQELAEHWKKATGSAAAVLTNATGKARWTFRLGRAARQIELKGLDKNDATIRVGAGTVDIAGVDGADRTMKSSTPLGTLFGVYSFLERKLGVRWLWPGELGTVCPRFDGTPLPPEEWTVRHMAFSSWRASANVKSPGWKDKAAARKFYSDQSLWLRRHRFATCDRLAKGHAFTSWFKEYGKTHPEWFNEMPDGTRRGDPFYFGGRADIISLCASNRELVKEIVRRWAEKDPTDIINGNENDTAGKCCCANCLAADATGDDAGRRARAAAAFASKSNGWWRALGSLSSRYCAFWNAILEEGRKVRPDCRVIGCVYANYSDPPAPGTRLDGSVVLRFCPPVMYPWTDDKVAFFKNTWEGWSATGAKLMMRPNFTLDGHNFPLAYYRRYADCYDFVRAHGLVAVDMDSLTGVYGANGLTTYVIASKNSSPERPLAALEDDYFSAFGSSAAVVRECYAQFEKTSEAGFGQADPDDTIEGGRYCDFMLSAYRVFPPALLEGACAKLSAAMAAEKDPVVVRRLAFVKTGLEDALLVLKSQRGFAEYQRTNDRALFSSAYAELLAFRQRNAGLGYLNLASVDFYESRHWPRHLGLLGPDARELDGWELNLNPDPDAGKWVPQKQLRHWRWDYNDIGWYRCRFTLSEEEARRFRRLVFGAVDGLPTVHLNGKVVQDGHPIPDPGQAWRTPFAVENVDAFKAGENEILIKIDKKVPGRRGLNRPVYIDVKPEK